MKNIILFLFVFMNLFGEVLVKGTKVYQKPNLKSKIIYVFENDQNLKLFQTKLSNWYRVRIDGKTGFVFLRGGGEGASQAGGQAGGQPKPQGRDSSIDVRDGDKAKGLGAPGGGKARGSQKGEGAKPLEGGKKITSRGESSRGGAAPMPSRSQAPQKREMTERERISRAHEEAKMVAEAQGQNFCSPCWYARNGADVERYEDTNPKFTGDGILLTGDHGFTGDSKVRE